MLCELSKRSAAKRGRTGSVLIAVVKQAARASGGEETRKEIHGVFRV
jgi:hypothetical protein